MAFLVAQHGAPGRRKLRQRERIRRGSGRHQEHGDLALERLGEPPLQASGDRIIAVAERKALVRLGDCLEDLRRYPGGVVAGELHGFSSARWLPAARPSGRGWVTPLRFGAHPCSSCCAEASFVATIGKESAFPRETSLALGTGIWHGRLGQQYCPNGRSARRAGSNPADAREGRALQREDARSSGSDPEKGSASGSGKAASSRAGFRSHRGVLRRRVRGGCAEDAREDWMP